jgi:3-deoxy-D-manno-octulosonate 8-phosphate phosphatase (KDO 8-P phosphatase)
MASEAPSTISTLGPDVSRRLAGLRVMAFDVDGIMTDGRLWYGGAGEEVKAFDAHDGHGIKMLRQAGLKVAIITSRRSQAVERRARDLGVHYCFQGVEAKHTAFQEMLAELSLDESRAGFMGDDLLDLPVLIRAGFAASVPAAPAAVRERVHYITTKSGGRGAVREVCDLILAASGRLDALIGEYLR